MNIYIPLFERIIALEDKQYTNRQELLSQVMKYKRQFAKEHSIERVPTNTLLLQEYRQAIKDGEFFRSPFLEKALIKRSVRSESGIVSIQVLTKPFWCPGKCIFCPNDPTMPKSYIKTEPGAMRALMNQFDPHKQVYNRLLSLYRTGHNTDKIEMIVLGGTWDVYPLSYKKEFLKGLYDACNTFNKFFKTLPELAKQNRDIQQNNVSQYLDTPIVDEQSVIGMPDFQVSELDIAFPATIQESISINQTAEHRIIGLTIETRPEYITDENCRLWREWGVTRLEMGLQSMFDGVLDINKRGHSVQQARQAVHKMRQYGFKFSIHFMPGLYGSTINKDIETFRLAYADPYIKPDEIKFYPTSVIPDTELFTLYTQGQYKPLTSDELVDIIKKVQRDIIPPYTRIKRLIRDIPATEIVAGSDITNLRQITEREMLQENKKSSDIREKLYVRLWENIEYCNNRDDFLGKLKINTISADNTQIDDTIKTYIVGKEIDITSFREFVSLDTRAREMRHRKDKNIMYIQLVARVYTSSIGTELFLSFEDELGYIYGFARLLLPDEKYTIQREGLGNKTALIRELHVYGQLARIHMREEIIDKTAQNKGFGSQLMDVAEEIAKKYNYKKLSVISGVGVREYYKKLGYELEGTYMVKKL